MTTLIRKVPMEWLPSLWPELKPWVAKAMRYHPFVDADDVLVLAMSGHLTVFVAIVDDRLVGTFMVELLRYPKRLVANIMVIGGRRGSMRRWLDEMLGAVESWAIGLGCEALQGLGRVGWARKAESRREGWETIRYAGLARSLAHERRQGRR
jgi:uncharacterized membrane protein YwzB